MTVEAVFYVVLLLLINRHVVQANLALVLLRMARARSIIHEATVGDLRQVLRLLLGHLTTASLTGSMHVLLLIVVHVGVVARFA